MANQQCLFSPIKRDRVPRPAQPAISRDRQKALFGPSAIDIPKFGEIPVAFASHFFFPTVQPFARESPMLPVFPSCAGGNLPSY
jgi:hypothetical protein